MKPLSIHIPTPCHEDWQQMTPVDKGRFCQSCAKQVVDFSLMTDQEVLNYLSKTSGNTCGRFANDQLQRQLQPIRQEKKKFWWVAAMMPLLLLFEKAKAQKENKSKGIGEAIIKLKEEQIVSVGEIVRVNHSTDYDYSDNNYTYTNDEDAGFNTKIKVLRQKGDPGFTIAGKIVDAANNKPIVAATVAFKGSTIATITDLTGNFILHGSTPEDHTVITVNNIGFEATDVYVGLKDTNAVVENTRLIEGVVLEEKTGTPISFVSISIKNGNQSTATDAYGKFTLAVTSNKERISLIASSVGFRDKEETVSLKDTGKITIVCQDMVSGNFDVVVVGGFAACRKPSKKDTIPTLIRKVFHAEKFSVFPNPTPRGNNITIDVKNEGIYSIQLFDNNGKLVAVKDFEALKNATQTMLAIPSSLEAGMYYIRVMDTKKKKQYTDKVVVM